MKELSKLLGAVRTWADMTPEDIAPISLAATAEHLERMPELRDHFQARWVRLRDEPAYPHFKAIAIYLAGLAPHDRLKAIDWMISHTGRYAGHHPWIAFTAAEQIAALASNAPSVRGAFDAALHPLLHVGLAASQEGRHVSLSFVSKSEVVCDLALLCAAMLGLNIPVSHADPFMRDASSQFACEIVMPPFGSDYGDRAQDVSENTLTWLGSSTTGRLSAEALTIADLMAHAAGSEVILALSDGALFRSVGVESMVREELVASRRLHAVLSVPSGMVFTETGIATSILMINSLANAKSEVRFLDLSDEQLSTQTSRGRFEARREPLWRDVLNQPAAQNGMGRDVPIDEIKAQSCNLTIGRYLQSEAVVKLDAFLSGYTTRPLFEVAELIRPVALRKSDDGGYVIFETSPNDIAENGFVAQPMRQLHIDRSGLRKARNQQLQPGDLILSVKGTIGKVGLIPHHVPDSDADEFWTVGQSMMILRPRAGVIAPETLFEYLSSDLVHERLLALAGGTAIQSINIKDLKSLPVPVPSWHEQEQVKAAFEKRQNAFVELERLRASIAEMRAQNWPHKSLQTIEKIKQ